MSNVIDLIGRGRLKGVEAYLQKKHRQAFAIPEYKRGTPVYRHADMISMYGAEHLRDFVVPESQELYRLMGNPMSKQDDKLKEFKRYLEHYQQKPLAFAKHELGINTSKWRNDLPPLGWEKRMEPLPLWSMQRKIIDALVKDRKVCVKSGHGCSKTFTAALAVLILTYVFKASGITTASTFRQVKRLLWAEIRKMYMYAEAWRQVNGKPPLGGKLNQVSLEIDEKWFVEGFSTDKPGANLPGYHADNIFVIVDEAGSTNPDLIDMIETVLTNELTWVLMIGNPIDPTHPFASMFKPGSGYTPFTMSCLDTPNVKHKRTIYPGMTSHKWVEERARKWGKDSALYKARVEGEFPTDAIEGLIPFRTIYAALERELNEVVPLTMGVDVARRGGDRIPIGVRYTSGRFKVLEVLEKRRITETEGRVIYWYDWLANKGGGAPKCINIDDIGVGGGVVDHLLEKGYPANGIDVSEAPTEFADEEQRVAFINKRAQYYWKLAQAYKDGVIGILPDSDDRDHVHYDLANECSKIRLKLNSRNLIQIMEKDEIKKLLKGQSPDLAECLMLAWAEDDWDETRELVRFL